MGNCYGNGNSCIWIILILIVLICCCGGNGFSGCNNGCDNC